MTRLSEKRLFLLDMDGTIYLSETLFDGTLDFLRHVRESGGRYLFLTNNSSRGTDAYVVKLARLGIEASAEDFLTSADATTRFTMSAERNPSKASSARQGCACRIR